jgi:putative transposase
LNLIEKRSLIRSDELLSITQQCELLSLSRSSFYYQPVQESEFNLKLMRKIDEIYLKAPFYGSRSIVMELKKQGEIVNRKKVQRLMRQMGLEAMYPKPKTSLANKEAYKYPYLLRNLEINKPNQVWGTDITYVPTENGYLYLTAILDLYSRYVISWGISDNLESDFCIQTVKKALKNIGRPGIMNSDQGCQYTSKGYINLLKENGVLISMSGKGRCWDNIFVERLWRSYKYEEVYLKEYITGKDVQEGADGYFTFYNNDRVHSKLGYETPKSVYFRNH